MKIVTRHIAVVKVSVTEVALYPLRLIRHRVFVDQIVITELALRSDAAFPFQVRGSHRPLVKRRTKKA
ncbi:hypothetical protein PoB_002869300 [Plakobranchus ocellatus]|uniref:Uncharacterized protein n=1 Tax=Plakobranchus ocellatus TaxID=259542 RepID=A0AAV4A6B9_9GAST|nr:hypothetical protein PoB_002869300 [Plakobranchus ocellatus]